MDRNRQLCTASALCCLFYATTVFAGHPAATDDAGTVDVGAYEVELSSARVDFGGTTVDGYGVALRRGFTGAFDAGVAAEFVHEVDTVYGFGFDTKFRFTEALTWRPAVFVRADASVPDVENDGSLTWDGLALGSTWGFADREISLEVSALGTEDGGDAVGLGAVWYQNIAEGWIAAAEFAVAPFVEGDVPQSAMLGVIHEFETFGALSFGFVFHESEGAWDDSEVTVGLTY